MQININDFVWVKLTDSGEDLLRGWAKKSNENCDPKHRIDIRNFRANNWFYKMQFHELVQIFGQFMMLEPFEDGKIYLSEPAQ